MPRVGRTRAYRFYADRFYLDRANRDTYLERDAAGDVGLSGSLVLATLKTVDGVDVSVHAADLDAHTRNPWEIARTGEYVWYQAMQGSGTPAMTANQLYAIPFTVPRAITIDRLAVEVTTGADGKYVRVGVYNNGTNLYPGTLNTDVGTALVTNTGIKAVTITGNLSLTKGLYWMAIVSDGTPSLRGCAFYYCLAGQLATDFSKLQHGWKVAFTYAALPDPFTTGGALQSTNVCPAVIPRLLSLD